ncbi:hypothetical protein VLK31_35935 [Variovorax sp. H27-G14]|uniref:hypothetical protein n=1 Tax=Variovorax sp. H27-G14 TaxID=3111914 RepID=UPI0038FBEA6C
MQPNEKHVDGRVNSFAQGLLALASVFLSTSAYSQQVVNDQYVLQNTKLSISPSGKKILITYGLKSEKPTSIVVQRENGKFVSKPLAPFDRTLRHLGFASNEQNLLEVSREESITTLARLNIDTGEKETIYKDPQDIWMPREIGLNDYVYFQATKQIPTQGIWVRQQNGVRKTLFPVPDRLSSTMNWTGESLYLMNWTNPRSFFALTGAVPAEA